MASEEIRPSVAIYVGQGTYSGRYVRSTSSRSMGTGSGRVTLVEGR